MSLIKKDINKRRKPKLKKDTDGLKIVTATIAVLLATNIFAISFHNSLNKNEAQESPEVNDSTSVYVATSNADNNIIKYEDLTFSVVRYAGKYYLMPEDKELLSLIKQSINEEKEEYLANGATPVFGGDSKKYSEIDEHLLYAMFQAETGYRLLEIKNPNGSEYDVNNYMDFHGDSCGIQYNGLGMISENTLKDMVQRDRKGVYNMPNYSTMNINNKPIDINFDNINFYQYVVKTNAKTPQEIKCALAECIQLNARSSYNIINRNIKDYIKRGTHEDTFKQLSTYQQMKNYTDQEIQIWFGLMAYNVGGEKIKNAIYNGDLFDLDKDGEYKYNVDYAETILDNYRQLKQGNILIY